MRWRVASFTLLAALLLGALPAFADGGTDVSGYELFTGLPCTSDNQPATCNDVFAGWTGGSGPGAGGWTGLPGSSQGAFATSINYVGSPGQRVSITGGNWAVALTDGTVEYGNVTGGSVVWSTTSACGSSPQGAPVATVTVHLQTSAGAPRTFNGCLEDMPWFQVIPPRIWGAFSS
jgi:hypothetical protein